MAPKDLIGRRSFLRLSGLTAAALVGGPLLAACNTTGPLSVSATPTVDFLPDLDLVLKATPSEVAILPGAATRVWVYQGSVVKGDAASVQAIPGSYLGPIIRVRKGQRVRVTLQNDLPEGQETIIHWHGLRVPASMDGHPRDAIAPSQQFVYEFEVTDQAGTYWFHPHPHGLTASQVIAGLAGLFIVSDDDEAKVTLPSGEFDLPVVIQDRVFDGNNQFIYGNDMMTTMMGFLGDRILINGQPDLTLPVATRAYRLRVLNGSNSRIYKLAWSDDTQLTVVGTDAGLLDAPVTRDYALLAPGERLELWADFSGRSLGDELKLISQGFTGAEGIVPTSGGSMGGMMGGGMMGNMSGAPALGTQQDLLTVRVERQEAESLTLPTTLVPLKLLQASDAVNANAPRQVVISQNNMTWKINGRDFDMDAVADGEKVKAGSIEIWDIVNEVNPGEMMDPLGMAHPFHIHGVHVQVLSRTLRTDYPEFTPGYESVSAGFVDNGWKDTVLIMPGETVRLLMRFHEQTGTFVYHCHNLEHADQGMMRNYAAAA